MAGSTTDVFQFENGLRSPLKIPVKFGKSCSEMKVAIGRSLCTNVLTGFVLIFLSAFVVGYPLSSIFNFGFLLLAARGLLGLFYGKGWLSGFGVEDKRRADWYLQIFGPGLIAMGNIHNILTEDIQWLSFYGQFVICALIFDCSNVLEGIASLWLFDL